MTAGSRSDSAPSADRLLDRSDWRN